MTLCSGSRSHRWKQRIFQRLTRGSMQPPFWHMVAEASFAKVAWLPTIPTQNARFILTSLCQWCELARLLALWSGMRVPSGVRTGSEVQKGPVLPGMMECVRPPTASTAMYAPNATVGTIGGRCAEQKGWSHHSRESGTMGGPEFDTPMWMLANEADYDY